MFKERDYFAFTQSISGLNLAPKLYVRSSHQSYSIKKVVLNNFVIFTGKQLCWSIFLIKLQAFKNICFQECT